MKNLKKAVSILLAMTMIFAMTMTAFAAPADLTGHQYKAYQIFAGDQAADKAELGNVEWGSGVNGASLLADLKADDVLGADFADCTTAADVAEALSAYDDSSTKAEAFAKVAYDNIKGEGVSVVNGDTTLDAGYYLVVDVTEFEEDAENTTRNFVLLQLTNKETFEIKNKVNVPESDKKVDDENDSVIGEDGEDGKDWQDSADYDIGDSVPFKLSGTVASDYDKYETYYFKFHDEEEKGLDFEAESVVVKVDGVEITEGFDVFTDCADGCAFEVEFKDLKAIKSVKAGSVITVEYTSVLNDNATIGYEGNVNRSRVEYSNEQGGGFTPWDNVIVFTYKVVVNKVDAEQKALAGAAFALYKWVANTDLEEGGSWEVVEEFEAGPDTTFGFEGLDDGKYKLVETVTPAGYNTIDDIEFEVTADHNITWNGTNRNAVLTALSGDKVSGEIKFTASLPEGSLTTDVVNQNGPELPETGGIGTTMFYVIGAFLVIGAAIVMITRKRMNK